MNAIGCVTSTLATQQLGVISVIYYGKNNFYTIIHSCLFVLFFTLAADGKLVGRVVLLLLLFDTPTTSDNVLMLLAG
jgi:hypothetical protein